MSLATGTPSTLKGVAPDCMVAVVAVSPKTCCQPTVRLGVRLASSSSMVVASRVPMVVASICWPATSMLRPAAPRPVSRAEPPERLT